VISLRPVREQLCGLGLENWPNFFGRLLDVLDAERHRRVEDDRRRRRQRVSLQVVDGDEAEDGVGVVDVLGSDVVGKLDRLAHVRVVEQREAVARTAVRTTKIN